MMRNAKRLIDHLIMKRASIYKYMDNLVFVPNGFLENGPIVSIEPITHLSVFSSDEALGHTLVNTLNFSKKMASSLMESNLLFKQLLRISKAKSNKNLVQNGQLIAAQLKEDIIQLELFESYIRYKSFGARKERLIINLDLKEASEIDMGKELKKLFNL